MYILRIYPYPVPHGATFIFVVQTLVWFERRPHLIIETKCRQFLFSFEPLYNFHGLLPFKTHSLYCTRATSFDARAARKRGSQTSRWKLILWYLYELKRKQRYDLTLQIKMNRYLILFNFPLTLAQGRKSMLSINITLRHLYRKAWQQVVSTNALHRLK